MGKSPCFENLGVKKGPWTPEEDIILASYIQEHGTVNWRSVPINAGLSRCSKGCRLRWTNYLRPGIKRGNFTDHEEKLISHLQALLGNRWAAIASYLPERTDSDIKNYWNTHLKKKARKLDPGAGIGPSNSKGQWEKRLQTDINKVKQALQEALSVENHSLHLFQPKPSCSSSSYSTADQSLSTYISSTENISRLLGNWKMGSPTKPAAATRTDSAEFTKNFANSNILSPETSLSLQRESKLSLELDSPLSLLETWLFDENYDGERDINLLDMAMDASQIDVLMKLN